MRRSQRAARVPPILFSPSHYTDTVVPQASTGDDPMPVPPRQPELEECCGTGCDPCIFDIYEAALERYRVALAAWEERQRAKRTPRAGTARLAHHKKPRRTRS